MFIRTLFALLIFLGAYYQADAETFTAVVTGITDGDTIKITHDGKLERIRLAEIDCPEHDQPFGQEAKLVTSSLCFGQEVTVDTHGQDRYGRTIATIMLASDKSLNDELVREGMAWQYKRYSQDTNLAQEEREAREGHIGLWQDLNPMPPWEYRILVKQAQHNNEPGR